MNSQNDEERVILEYFKGFLGCFLDLGANDGITFSNTAALAMRGWYGVMVEPSIRSFDKLLTLYGENNRIFLYNLAIGKVDGEIDFYESGSLVGVDDHSLVSTIVKSEVSRFEKTVTYEQKKTECMTWMSFNKKHIPTFNFDFISIDIEGSELDVLPYMDLSMTRLICIEWNGKEDLKKEYEKYLSGFKLIHVTGENLIYGR